MSADIETISRAQESAGNVEAQAKAREIEIAERIGAVVPVQRVREAAAGAMAAVKGRFGLDEGEDADHLAALTSSGRALVRPHLRELQRRTLEIFTAETTEAQFSAPEPVATE